MVFVFAIGYLLLNKTVFGRQIYSVGSNPVSALNSGISVSKIQLFVYSFSGLFAGIAGLLFAARTGAFQPFAPDSIPMELSAIAAVAIGGASLSGGKGTIWGTFLGAMLSGLLFNLLTFLNLNPYIQELILGVIILLAVSFNAYKRLK